MRHPNWLGRLHDYLAMVGRKRFDLVSCNCAHFIIGALHAVTDETPEQIMARAGVPAIPGTEVGVLRLLSERGDMAGIAEAYFGCPPRADLARMRRGDVALLDGTRGDTLGVVDAGGIVAVTEAGIARYPLISARGFWSVG